MALIVGITGGIGSGKSTIACGLKQMGYKVYLTDIEAKKIMQQNPCVRSQIELLFGSDIYENDVLNSKQIAAQVFADSLLLQKLNSIVHPAVIFEVKEWAKQLDDEVCFVESAILFESGLSNVCDKIIVVAAPDELRIERVMGRDGLTKEQVMSRMANQLSQEQMQEKADLTLINDGNSTVEHLCLCVQKFCRNFAGYKQKSNTIAQ